MFRLFENFVNGDTKAIEVLFYQGTSNNNDKHIFTMAEPIDTGLSGIEIDNKIHEHVSKARREWEFEQLKKDNAEWKEYAEELEEDINKLEKELQEIKSSQSPLHGFIGEIGSSLVSGIVRQNPKLVDKIPALSGLVEGQDRPMDIGQEPGSDIEFKASPENTQDRESIEAVSFVRHIQHHFQNEKFDKLMLVIDLLAKDTSKLDQVINQLKSKEDGNI